MGCTVQELGQRMTAQEFGEWQVFYEREQLHPAAQRYQDAQHMAAIHNGPLSRADKSLWKAAHLMPADPWAPIAPEPPPPDFATLQAQVKAMNSGRTQ